MSFSNDNFEIKMKAKKILAGRVTKQQKQKIIDFMKENTALGCGLIGPDSAKTNNVLWSHLSKDLNAGGGAVKTVDQWKRCWADWKAAVKKQYGAIKQFNEKSEILPSLPGPKELDELECQMVQFFCKDVSNVAYKSEPSSPSKKCRLPTKKNSCMSQLEIGKNESSTQMERLLSKIDELLEEQKKTNKLLQEQIKDKKMIDD